MQKLILISATCAVLTACGGGGGSDTQQSSVNSAVGPAVALTGANYEPATKEVVGTVGSAQSSSGSSFGSSLFTGAQINDSLASPGLLLQRKLPQVIKLMKQDARLTGAVSQATENCGRSGSLAIVANDNNNNGDLDAGDEATITFNDCAFDATSLTGKMSFRVNSVSELNNSVTADLSVKIEGLSTKSSDVTSLTNGSFDMKITPVSYGVTNVHMVTPLMTSQTTQGGTTKVYQYKNYIVDATSGANSGTWTVNGNVSVPTLGANTAEIKTTEPFSFTSLTAGREYATAGALDITFRDGGKVRVTASGSSAKIVADLDNNGLYEQSKTLPWVDLL